MRQGKYYIPCLRWKQGEYLAIEHLPLNTKNLIMPLIEIPEIGYDFQENKEVRSIEEHLNLFTKRVNDKWGHDECFVDIHIIDTSKLLTTGQHPAIFVFDDLRLKGVQAVPVVWVNQDFSFQSAIFQTVHQDSRGICIRINLEEAANPTILNSVNKLLKNCGVKVEQSDLILDLGAPNFDPLDGFIGLVETTIRTLPYLKNWRSFGLIGTSFPASLSGVNTGLSYLPRKEWLLYKGLVVNLKTSSVRIPTFGDYAVNHPEISNLDYRITKPKANIRYALSDRWLIARGQNVRDYGYEQHRDLCKLIIRSNEYCGETFSPADKYIYDCAKGKVGAGNLSTWRQIGTNHHIEIAVKDVANFGAS